MPGIPGNGIVKSGKLQSDATHGLTVQFTLTPTGGAPGAP
jgi:hypothetical protein